MGRADYYKPGSHNVICDRCGMKYKAEDTRMTWDNLRVCKKDWEARHPQDFLRGKVDKISVTNPRPEQTDRFLGDNDVSASDL